MTRVPFSIWVVGVTALVALGTWMARPGSASVLISALLGSLVAGLFAWTAVRIFNRIRAEADAPANAARRATPEEGMKRLTAAFAGLMLARMVGYGAFLTALFIFGAGSPVAACAGLAVGTLVFQVLEIIYLKSLKLEKSQ